MLAVRAVAIDPEKPLDGLRIEEVDEPSPPAGWTTVTVKAAALNHHDLWSLRGVGLKPEQLPMTLGTDAAGLDEDGNEVIVHAVISSPDWRGDETFDPKRTLLSEKHQGAFSERLVVPRANLVPKPPQYSFEEAACLPTAWLTAYRMIFTRGLVQPGATMLVQGAGGGVATAAIALGRAAGIRVWASSRSEEKRQQALELGADAVFDSGERLPEKVDAVMETIGKATWDHSLRSLKPGGVLVVSGATSGPNPPADLNRVFFLQLSVVGSTMGTREELGRLAQLMATAGLSPTIHASHPVADAAAGFRALAEGEVFGKVVFTF